MKIGITERGDGGISQGEWRKAIADRTVDGAIVITKAPQLLVGTDIPENVIIHATITGLGGTKIEPGVAPLRTTIEAYKRLKERLEDRIVLRIDPILWDEYFDSAIDVLIMAKLMDNEGWQEHTRLRISFIDMYPHVIKRFSAAGIKCPTSFHLSETYRREMFEMLGEPEVCGEPGLPCTGCISPLDIMALHLPIPDSGKSKQRSSCACLAVKTELLNNRHPCPHGCLYCYWK